MSIWFVDLVAKVEEGERLLEIHSEALATVLAAPTANQLVRQCIAARFCLARTSAGVYRKIVASRSAKFRSLQCLRKPQFWRIRLRVLSYMIQAPFISLDGLDGSGKSTQSRMLLDWLHERGITAVRCCDPGSTVLGDKLRAILLDHRDEISLRAETMLFMASQTNSSKKSFGRAWPTTLSSSATGSCSPMSSTRACRRPRPRRDMAIGHFATAASNPTLPTFSTCRSELAATRTKPVADRRRVAQSPLPRTRSEARQPEKNRSRRRLGIGRGPAT